MRTNVIAIMLNEKAWQLLGQYVAHVTLATPTTGLLFKEKTMGGLMVKVPWAALFKNLSPRSMIIMLDNFFNMVLM